MSLGAPPLASRTRVLHRDTLVVTCALVLLSAAAWTYLVWTPMEGMARGVLARGHDSMAMSVSLPLFAVVWTVMMVAMMFPATSPVVLIFDRWRRSKQRSALTTAAFVAGYLIVWIAAGVVAFAAIVALDTQIARTPTAVRIGGAVLVVAGVYQLTPLKTVCLRQCRSPLSLIMKHAELLGRGARGPLQVGMMHGGYCLGCCWALMAVLVALGVMHLGWMAAVSALILAEKVLPGGRRTANVTGAALLGAGLAVLVTGVGVGT